MSLDHICLRVHHADMYCLHGSGSSSIILVYIFIIAMQPHSSKLFVMHAEIFYVYSMYQKQDNLIWNALARSIFNLHNYFFQRQRKQTCGYRVSPNTNRINIAIPIIKATHKKRIVN